MNFDEFMNFLVEHTKNFTTEDDLIDYAIKLLRNDDFEPALDILQAIYNNPYFTEFYEFEYGNEDYYHSPRPIAEISDIKSLVTY